MRLISAQQIAQALDFPQFIEALRRGFKNGAKTPVIAPLRHHHEIVHPDQSNATMLLMPAWTDFEQLSEGSPGYSGIKIVNVTPDNSKIDKASVQAVYVLNNGRTGEPIALIDGHALTFWRTAAASALASDYLSIKQAKSMLMIGAGALAPWLIKAHRAIRPIENVYIWNRTNSGAQKLVQQLGDEGISAQVTNDLEATVHHCDIISAATLSTEPIIKGIWLSSGTHLDLVGAFTPAMRESDDECIKRARIFVDTMEGALSEAGDITQPIRDGLLKKENIRADLFTLSAGTHVGRKTSEEITLFKSTGASLEDLVGAILIAETVL